MPGRHCAALLALLATPAWAGPSAPTLFSSIPTLDEVGLGLLVALVAGVAGWAIRRRSRR